MIEKRIENLNVFSEDTIITPDELKRVFPLSEKSIQTVMHGQEVIKNILNRKDPRLFVVVGPCSIHDVDAALDYATLLTKLAKEVDDTLVLVMRVYFEKPRTKVGWQGLINDPYLDHSYQIEEGLKLARQLLLEIANMGLPVAGEALDLVTPQYVQDLISWTAIGARTTESQNHRKMASGFTSAVGFKNGTNGDLEIVFNAMHSAASANHFVSVDPSGKVAVVRTKGNANTHPVLRGGGGKPNFDAKSIAICEQKLIESALPVNIMVDCSHKNSNNEPARQIEVIADIAQQIKNGNQSIISIMIESNINWGQQNFSTNRADLKYGISVTDDCIDWEATEKALLKMRKELKDILPARMK